METININVDAALLDLLSKAPAEDLDVLVDHLTDRGEGRMTLPSAIKELLLSSQRQKLYTNVTLKILIRELQQFGGNTVANTLANLGRRSGVGYGEIVRDVFRHLGGKDDSSMTLEKLELAAVSLRLAQLWPTLDKEAKLTCLSGINQGGATSVELSDLQTAVFDGGRAAAAIARRLAQCPYVPNHASAAFKDAGIGGVVSNFASAALLGTGYELAGAAYRVTVPCVMQVAYLRQRLVVAGALSCPECGTAVVGQAQFCGKCGHDLRAAIISVAPTASQRVAVLPIASTHDNGELIINDGGGMPVLSVTSLASLDTSHQLQSLDLDTRAIDRLAPLLQAIPSMAVGAEVAAHRYLKVLVNGPLALTADGDGRRGYVVGANKKIIEHGRFYEDDRLKNLVSGAAIFQIASVVVAQKHLADISQKLGEIQVGIARIEAFQQNERKSGINGTLGYLRQIAPVVLAGDLSSSIRAELETSERELGILQNHLLTDLNAMIVEVRKLKDPGTFGSSGLTKALQDRQTTFEDLVEQWKLCLAARFIACRLLCCYPGELALVERRQDTLNQLAQSLLGPDGFLVRFREGVAVRREGMKALIDTQVEIQANQERLLLWDICRLPAIESQARSTFDQLDTMLRENAEPVELVLEMQGDKVMRALTA